MPAPVNTRCRQCGKVDPGEMKPLGSPGGRQYGLHSRCKTVTPSVLGDKVDRDHDRAFMQAWDARVDAAAVTTRAMPS